MVKLCKCGRYIYDLSEAERRMPRCLGGHDPLRDKRVEDLAFLAQTELDFYFDGEDGCTIKTRRQLHQVQSYLSALKHSIEPCEKSQSVQKNSLDTQIG